MLPRKGSGFFERESLTKLVVDRVGAGPRDIIIWDRDLKCFGLKVTPSGRKVYLAFYRTRSGQQRKPTICVHGKVTTEEARQIPKRWIAQALTGEDISGERQVARAALLIRELAEPIKRTRWMF